MKEYNGSWSLNPQQNFNLHFEPQYDVLNMDFNILLHYEVYPYCTQTWVRNNIPPHQYDEYLTRRQSFVNALKVRDIEGWTFGGRSNQIAKAIFNFRDRRFRDVRNVIEDLLKTTTIVIDDVFSKLHNKVNTF